jgi:hypothetical protein
MWRVSDEELARLNLKGSTHPVESLEIDTDSATGGEHMRCVVGNTGTLSQCLDRQPLLSGHFANPQPHRHSILLGIMIASIELYPFVPI